MQIIEGGTGGTSRHWVCEIEYGAGKLFGDHPLGELQGEGGQRPSNSAF